MKKAVCIMSGGMDSTLCAYIAKSKDYFIIPVHFNYGQKTEQKELKAYKDIASLVTKHKGYEIDAHFFKNIGASSLTDENLTIPTDGLSSGVPSTYVPFRNGIFISIATAIAEKEKASDIFIGVIEEDSSGYPDCKDEYITSMQKSINFGTKDETKLNIVAPLVNLSKEDIVKEAIKYKVPLHLTWSCYKNQDRACGVCDSCILRLRGFKKANSKDPIIYE